MRSTTGDNRVSTSANFSNHELLSKQPDDCIIAVNQNRRIDHYNRYRIAEHQLHKEEERFILEKEPTTI